MNKADKESKIATERPAHLFNSRLSAYCHKNTSYGVPTTLNSLNL